MNKYGDQCCPSCGDTNVLTLFSTFECTTPSCCNYSQKWVDELAGKDTKSQAKSDIYYLLKSADQERMKDIDTDYYMIVLPYGMENNPELLEWSSELCSLVQDIHAEAVKGVPHRFVVLDREGYVIFGKQGLDKLLNFSPYYALSLSQVSQWLFDNDYPR